MNRMMPAVFTQATGFLIFWRLMLKAGGPADTESRLLYFVMSGTFFLVLAVVVMMIKIIAVLEEIHDTLKNKK